MAPQLEKLDRGLVAVKTADGVYLSWRFLREEARGAQKDRLTGADFIVLRNGDAIAKVTDSTNYVDHAGTVEDEYAVAAILDGETLPPCTPVKPWANGYLDIPLHKPEGSVTPAGQPYEYTANDLSMGDVDGDGQYELFVKWDPTNSQDVSIKGYTGKCYIDCIKLDGTLLWRVDMGVNIRAGAHYTQFMVYDFDGDGRAEMAVKTAPGTCITRYNADGTTETDYITLLPEDVEKGVTHGDNYVCSAEDYRQHMAEVFRTWHEHPEVKAGHWPRTLEECFGIAPRYEYPLSAADALALADYFIDEYAPSRSPRNELRKFEGFIYDGPEYLTMFSGDGRELQTIAFPFPRVDDGLMWGDYAWFRIEPCNRVDRFLSGVAYLDGVHPSLIVCRGYYTRACIAAYDFKAGKLAEKWRVDSGFVPMQNPFARTPGDAADGTHPEFGCIAGQGNHSLSTADVDGDGCMEIIYGAATIDHDGTILDSSRAVRPDGVMSKLGHGDAMHVAKIDPDRGGYQIFNVFEEGKSAPYGYALRDAATGEVLFGEYCERDLGRCMIGDVTDGRGLEVWAMQMRNCKGEFLDLPKPSTNMKIYWAGDLTTQFTDGADYLDGKPKCGLISDLRHGAMLCPEGTRTNNGTKGNPGLVADVFGDFREEILLRTEDSTAIRVYVSTDVTTHKLHTLMHDAMYRCGVAWQNNCYNQPGYPSFYYAHDMDFRDVWAGLKE